MSDDQVRQTLIDKLGRLPNQTLVVSRDGKVADRLWPDGLPFSKTRIKRALGSLIARGQVVRNRCLPQSKDDDDRPITLKLVPPV